MLKNNEAVLLSNEMYYICNRKNIDAMLRREFQYYLDNQSELVERYNGRVLVIVGEDVIGDYDNETEAYFMTEKNHELGTFLIQKCTPGKEAYTQTFRSRVVFA